MSGSQHAPESPFGRPSGDRRVRATRLTIYGGVVVAALVATFLVTRNANDSEQTTAHDHAATATGDSAASVHLSAAEAQRIGVTFATATIGPLSKEVRTVGQVTYDETRVKSISPKIDGFVEQLFVNYTGQSVRRGEPLLSIYSPMLVTAQEELLLAKRLTSDVSAGTPDAVRGAQDLLASARRRLLSWDIPASEVERVERTGEVRRALTLVSPASGFVVEKAVLSGQRIMAGDPLYRIVDLSVVWVEGEVFEQDLAALRVGQGVASEFETFPGERWLGRISYIQPTLNPETRTARIRVELPNAGLRLKPGMYATLRLTATARANVLTIPRSAVLATGERMLVFVKGSAGKLEPREVALGVTTSERVEVRRGIAAGEEVVASATFLVDAEANLGTALGGMGNMPGMDLTAPSTLKDAPGIALPPAKPSGHEE
jgi:Cu(I)/Ag(I) efflux system membrane fusion protein